MVFGTQVRFMTDVIRARYHPLDAGINNKSALKAKIECGQQITQVVMQVVVSLFVLVGSFLVIFYRYDELSVKSAVGAMGVVLGYWLR